MDLDTTSIQCQQPSEAAAWVYNCTVKEITDLLNMAFICDRKDLHTVIFVVLYILVSLVAMGTNASVVLASIVERWKEIDQFTFVFAVSLSFNHFLVAFLVYPLGAYTMLRTDGWQLGKYWCTSTAYCSSYFEVLYMMHVLMIGFDMLLYRFTKLKDVVKVYLCKKVAMSLWVTALIPHIILSWKNSWFLLDGGTLGSKAKYLKCAENDTDENGETLVINCFVTYTFTSFTELWLYILCFPVLPFAYAACFYVMQLYLRKRSLFKNKGPVEICGDDRTFTQRYKASLCMISVFTITQVPKWITSIFLLYMETSTDDTELPGNIGGINATIPAGGPPLNMDDDRANSYGMVIGMDFLSFWTCLGSILIPFCYMMTCPTYFHAVTATRPLKWLRRHGEFIHGRTYASRYKLSQDQEEGDAPLQDLQLAATPAPPPLNHIPSITKTKPDKKRSYIYQNNGSDDDETRYIELTSPTPGGPLADVPAGDNHVIVNQNALTDATISSEGMPSEVSFLEKSSNTEAENLGDKSQKTANEEEPANIASPHVQTVAPIKPVTSAINVAPAKPERPAKLVVPSMSELSAVPVEEKEKAKRTLPVPGSRSRAATAEKLPADTAQSYV